MSSVQFIGHVECMTQTRDAYVWENSTPAKSPWHKEQTERSWSQIIKQESIWGRKNEKKMLLQ
jgi:hypothetical protein